MQKLRVRQIAVIHGDLGKAFPYYPNHDWESNDNQIISRLNEALAELDGYRFTFFSNHDTLWADLEAAKPRIEMVLQLCDDGFMNDSGKALHICAMLDLLGLPYTGTGVRGMAVTADKQAQIELARTLGIPVPQSQIVAYGAELPRNVTFPAFVKPNATDGSFGITRKSVVRNRMELEEAIRVVREDFSLKCPALIQQFLDGPDVTVSLLGNAPDRFEVLPVTEEDYSALPPGFPRICGYESKVDQNSPYWQIQSKVSALPARDAAFMIDASKRLFGRLELQDYGRFDWRMDAAGRPHFLEANANCGWCWDGHLAKAAALGNVPYAALFDRILHHAFRRYESGGADVSPAVHAVPRNTMRGHGPHVQRETTVAVILGDAVKPDPFKITASLEGSSETAAEGLKAALDTLPEFRFEYFNDHDRLVDDLTERHGAIDLVLNLCDQGFGNDPAHEAHIPALLEILGLPYTGTGPNGLTACYDKLLVYAIAEGIGIPVPQSRTVLGSNVSWDGAFPAFVKPNFADGGFGIARESVVQTPAELDHAVRTLRQRFKYQGPFIVQEYLPGSDLSIGLLGNPPNLAILPILEENYTGVPSTAPHIGSYEAKWDSEAADSPYRTIDWVRATLPPETERRIVEASCALFERLECRDYARLDWRLDAQGRPRLLEVNPNPGWDYWTYLATMAGWADISYPEMLRRILNAAMNRSGRSGRSNRGKP